MFLQVVFRSSIRICEWVASRVTGFQPVKSRDPVKPHREDHPPTCRHDTSRGSPGLTRLRDPVIRFVRSPMIERFCAPSAVRTERRPFCCG